MSKVYSFVVDKNAYQVIAFSCYTSFNSLLVMLQQKGSIQGAKVSRVPFEGIISNNSTQNDGH